MLSHTIYAARNHNICTAVALNCEIGTAASRDPELIHVTLIDYFSEEVLVDNLVNPDVQMQHLNTRYSRVSWADLKNARIKGVCLSGKLGARQAI
jgi:RNA exonuclease 1